MIGINKVGSMYSPWRTLHRYQATCSRHFSTQVARNDQVEKLYAPVVIKEVGPPTGGGPVYWGIRRFLMRARESGARKSMFVSYNFDFGRACFAGCPKQSFDPKLNQWVFLMDNDLWDGTAGRVWNDVACTIFLNMFIAMLIYYSWFRIVSNNKHNAWARWAKTEEDDE
ncbi:hypothetical protein BEWA_053350 [Theileria equi strain WA]|uniref:Uncharacterized protein n=1 Tax=Theileria equi strain WA TaxID=1537102 RepID=L1LDH1_THEEQ|nr:hypothetical protein BEWA_053350 [Theileria equi strain WA]EKX73280.1 hypothetical protein BEWA_053350 [Theileria equi strain WA]|eukprot:XP_004832732.1 hypothetical protein BEWA_053350 [Theileria equi strain WA]